MITENREWWYKFVKQYTIYISTLNPKKFAQTICNLKCPIIFFFSKISKDYHSTIHFLPNTDRKSFDSLCNVPERCV